MGCNFGILAFERSALLGRFWFDQGIVRPWLHFLVSNTSEAVQPPDPKMRIPVANMPTLPLRSVQCGKTETFNAEVRDAAMVSGAYPSME